ncbi:MAG TPA: YfhO family protein [Longimicrobium sp.]|nr:YfhO family protein [Longimicrobium sp.]
MSRPKPAPPRASTFQATAPADTELPLRLRWAALAYLVLALVYFFPAFLPGQQVYGTDHLAGGYPFYDFFASRFGAGELPKWVPYVYGGMPVFANPGSAYHPVHILAELLLPTGKVLAAIFLFHFWLAGVGMYLLARELGCRPWVSFVAGIAFQFTGVIMSWVYAGHDGRVMVSTLAPLFFFCLHRGIRTGSLAAFAGAAAALGSALLSFQIQNSYYLLVAGLFWAIFCLFHLGVHRSAPRLAKTVVLGLAAVALGFVIAAVNFLPFQDYVAQSPRGMQGGRGWEYSTSFSMPTVGLVGMAVPEFVGANVADPETGEPLFPAYRVQPGFRLHTEYVGAFVLVLLALGAFYARRSRAWWFFIGLAVWALTMALGSNTPFYRLYYEALPGLKRFRAPDLAYYVAAFALVTAAALALERIAGLRETSRLRKTGAEPPRTGLDRLPWIAGGVVALAVIGAMLGSAEPAGVQPGGPSRGVGWIRFAFFAAMVGGALWLWVRGTVSSAVAAVLLSLVTAADLWIIDRRFFHTIGSAQEMFAPDDVTSFLAAQPGPFRVWTFPYPQAYRAGGPNGSNYPMLFGIQQAGGEHPNPLQRWVEYVGAGTEVITDWHNFLPQDRAGVVQTPDGGQAIQFQAVPGFLEAANIRYVVSMAPLVHPDLRPVHQGSALVYENTRAQPRAWLAPQAVEVAPDGMLRAMTAQAWDPARVAYVPPGTGLSARNAEPLTGQAQVTRYTPDRVTLRANASRPALLVLADNWYEGWKATVDGREVPIVRANHTFRGVAVPAGQHTVEMTFAPGDLRTGFTLYLAAWALVAALLALPLLRGQAGRVFRRRAEPAPE